MSWRSRRQVSKVLGWQVLGWQLGGSKVCGAPIPNRHVDADPRFRGRSTRTNRSVGALVVRGRNRPRLEPYLGIPLDHSAGGQRDDGCSMRSGSLAVHSAERRRE